MPPGADTATSTPTHPPNSAARILTAGSIALRAELALAADLLGSAPDVDTVFVGGGTPSLLGADGPDAVLDAVREHFVLARGAEVTTEANPESTSPELFDATARAPGTPGCRSACSRRPGTCWRYWTACTRRAGRPRLPAKPSRAGFDHVNLDLIYGTPGESDDDLLRSVDAAIEAGVDHISAYALVVEDGTAMARRVRRGEIAAARRRRARASLRDCSTHGCRRPVSTGTRCRTGADPAASAGTTWVTGTAASGGAPDRVRTATSARRDGGMSSTPTLMRNRWQTGRLPGRRLRAARCRRGSHRGRDAAVAAARRAGRRLAERAGTCPRRNRRSVTDCCGKEADRLVLTDRGRLLADAVVRTLLD